MRLANRPAAPGYLVSIVLVACTAGPDGGRASGAASARATIAIRAPSRPAAAVAGRGDPPPLDAAQQASRAPAIDLEPRGATVGPSGPDLAPPVRPDRPGPHRLLYRRLP